MKIAILTQPLSTNYGGILQAWALQRVLRSMGHEPITVDRHYNLNSSLIRLYAGKTKRALQNIIYRFRGETLYSENLAEIRGHQAKFIDSNIHRTKPIFDDQALRQYFSKSRFDAVVVGSDQVWRPKYAPRLETYFLDFLYDDQIDIPTKVSYAASFGVSEWEYSECQTKVCKQLIKNFDAVSVREKDAVALCQKHFDVSASMVIDPTLLVNKQDYISEFCQEGAQNSKGVLTYLLDSTGFKQEVKDAVARSLGEECFSRQAASPEQLIKINQLDNYCYPPTNEWVEGFHQSKFVVTDSFHGVVFSLIFEKPFIAIVNPGRGAARFESLLELVGLKDRLLYPDAKYDIDKLVEPIDFDDVRRRLDSLQESSFKFLRQYL
ncbi:polysaccharide pyruvyl transferase family protein [Pseudoalteromonas sp. HL-AS2]|uniref:polysaccharide pyruvyl transferase family protein n=1 Tax=Pseudoalteromonas sp. HL-AS2 TaxID=3071082 RepID=UPI002815F294|nr:polysaccharide pyruvyl transferase family protein [Pseudoalteromonas sp. HL-AS2]WMS94894.1 polysaccharide pyruvyl transferase family protein [Pseudoalteromonas sp. HL-AS2]